MDLETQQSLFLQKEEISQQSIEKSEAIARLLSRWINESKTLNIVELTLSEGIIIEGDEQTAIATNTLFRIVQK